MKIEIESFDDLFRLSELVTDAMLFRNRYDNPVPAVPNPRAETGWGEDSLIKPPGPAAQMATFNEALAAQLEEDLSKLDPDVTTPLPFTEDDTGPSLPEEAAAAPELDADGRRWDARIDSSNKGLNKDGTWRARRNHGLTEDEVTGIKAELMKEANDAAEVAEEADEPAATETHPLPADDEPETVPAAPADEDFTDLIESAKLIAGDQRDGLMDVLNAAKTFTAAHSPHTFHLLREAACAGKTLQQLDPGERRLLMAAISLYGQDG